MTGGDDKVKAVSEENWVPVGGTVWGGGGGERATELGKDYLDALAKLKCLDARLVAVKMRNSLKV